MGLVYERRNQPHRALELYQELIQLQPGIADNFSAPVSPPKPCAITSKRRTSSNAPPNSTQPILRFKNSVWQFRQREF